MQRPSVSEQLLPGPGPRALRINASSCRLVQPKNALASDAVTTSGNPRTVDQVFLTEISSHTAVILLRSDGSFSTELQPHDRSHGSAQKIRSTAAVQQSHSGQCTLRGVTQEDLADVLTRELPVHFRRLSARQTQAGGWDCTQILPSQDGGTDAPILLRLRWPEGGRDNSPRLSAERLSLESSAGALRGMSSLQTFILHAEVLVGMDNLVDGPLVSIIELSLPLSKGPPTAAHKSGAMRLILGHLTSPQRGARGSLVFEAGPVEAVLTPVWGPIVSVCACYRPEMLSARRPPSWLALVPPIFVCASGGVYCVLSHQVLSADLRGLVAMAPVPSEADGCNKQNWSGVSVLLLADSGELYVAMLEPIPSTCLQAAEVPPEERVTYDLTVTRVNRGPVPCVAPGALPLTSTPCLLHFWQPANSSTAASGRSAEAMCWLCRWLPRGGVEVLRLEFAGSSAGKSMELTKATQLPFEEDKVVSAIAPSHCFASRRVLACCTVRAASAVLDRLCLAFEEPMTSRELSSLELWHPGSPSMTVCHGSALPEPIPASSGVAAALRTSAVRMKKSWPADADLIDVGDDPGGRGTIVAVTSFSCSSTQVFRVKIRGQDCHIEELTGWGQQSSQLTRHMSFMPGAGHNGKVANVVLQLTSRELVVFCGVSGRNLCTRSLRSVCCSGTGTAAPDASQRYSAYWVFAATASVLARHDVSVPSQAASAELRDGPCHTYPHQIAALCVLPVSDSGGAPRVAAAFWLSKAVAIIDGTTLAEICRCDCACDPNAGACSFAHASSLVAIAGGHVLLASADGCLVHMQCKQDVLHAKDGAAQGEITLAGVWPLHDGPLHVVPHLYTAQSKDPCVLALGRGGVSYVWYTSGNVLSCQSTGVLSAIAARDSNMVIAVSDGCSTSMDGGKESCLCSAVLELKEGPVISVQCELMGQVLDMVHSPRLGSILVVARAPTGNAHTSRFSLALVLFDESLCVLSVMPLTGQVDPKLQSLGCGISTSIHELWDGVLLAASAQGGGAPRMLVRARISKVQDDGSWLDVATSRTQKNAYDLQVLSTLELDTAVLVATHSAPQAPLLLSAGSAADAALRTLDDCTLVERHVTALAGLHLEGKGVIVGLAITQGTLAQWAPVAVAAAGVSFYACVALAAGAPAVLQLQASSSNVAVLRQVLEADLPLPPLLRLGRVEGGDSAMPSGFIGFDAAGRCYMWRLAFDAGPLDRPSVELKTLPQADGQLSRRWLVGRFAACDPRKRAEGGGICICVLAADSRHAGPPRVLELTSES